MKIDAVSGWRGPPASRTEAWWCRWLKRRG